MLGPIPNSLTAGAYNGTFFPHGLVTFSSRFLVVVRQEICIDGEVHSQVTLEALLSAQALLDAGYVDQIPCEGESVTIKTADGEVVTIRALSGAVEEC